MREKHYGPRGKASFARHLGIRASTYHHYEIDRSPPAEVLVAAARLTRTSLEWLLTGEGPVEASDQEPALEPAEETIARLRRLLVQQPDLERNVAEFLNLLESTVNSRPAAVSGAIPALADTADLVPIVGSTAAGPARFWNELNKSASGAEHNRHLGEMLKKHTQRASRRARLKSFDVPASGDPQVSLVQYSRPDELGTLEFLACAAAKTRYPTCVAWRIDGDSMSPRYNDGDFVITSADAAAVDGQPCVAHQKGQIGVNCKLYHREGDEIVLIPVNETHEPQRLAVGELDWVQRVLYSVRLSTNQ